jgi:hypothetical protein
MADFLTEQDCAPNLNSATIAGKVIKVEKVSGKTVGLVFHVGYQKHWKTGVQEIPIKCYISGAERIEKLNWLKAGAMALVSGEIDSKGSVYAMRVEDLSGTTQTSKR